MKKEVKDKLIEVGSFIICVAILLGIAYYTGFLKGFTSADFQDAYNNTMYNLNKSVAKSQKINLLDTSSKNGKSVAKYNSYQPQLIPRAVIRGVDSSGAWKQIFYSDKKVVFYIYKSSESEFNNSIQNYLSSASKRNQYELYAYSDSTFGSMRRGDVGPSKICDSLQECNAVRQKASDYSALSEFLSRCGATMCIINPSAGQYIRLKNKNSGQAVKVLFDMAKW